MSETAEHEAAGGTVIDAATARAWSDRREAVIVDVREPVEHATRRIPGSELLPLSRFDPKLLDRHQGRRIVLVCRSGNRSVQAAARLRADGREVYELRGGLLAWSAAGLPTVGEDNAPLDLFRQVQLVTGSLVVAGTGLGAWVSPWLLILPGLVGSGLVFAGATGTCGMARLLARMPWNRRVARAATCAV